MAKNLNNYKYDLAVIGAGPAGLMAAGRAAELGARVILVEKNLQAGLKLLLTGGGRANITNLKSPRALAKSFGAQGAWLLSGFSKFGPAELIEFFNSRGLKTKVEAEDRVFPASNSAKDVLRFLLNYIKSPQLETRFSSPVKKIIASGQEINKIILRSGEEISAKKYLIATGGQSYPATGSSGDAYTWLKALGHTIIKPRPALCPIIVKDKFIKELEGLTISEVGVKINYNNKKIISASGPVLFTASGLSGPTILNLSSRLGALLAAEIKISLDFFPDFDSISLDKKLQLEFAGSNRQGRHALSNFFPPRLASLIIKISGLDPNKKLNLISRPERLALLDLIKDFKLNFSALGDFDWAMITAGGVDIKEVEARTLASKLIKNLYLAGEVLDLDGPSGGYNLQLAWTSGYLAGESAAAGLNKD